MHIIIIILLLLCGCTKQKPKPKIEAQIIDITKFNTIEITKEPKKIDQLQIKSSSQPLLEHNPTDNTAKTLTNIITLPKKPPTKREIPQNRYKTHQEWTQDLDSRIPNSKKQAPAVSIPLLDVFKKNDSN